MKKFKFRLESVLRLRQQAEDTAREALARALARTRDAREAVVRLLTEMTELDSAWQSALQEGRVDAQWAQQCDRYRDVLGQRLKQAQAAVAEAEKQESQARKDLGKAMQQRQVLEKLRDKQLTEHRAEEMKREQFEMEDTSSARHHTDPAG